LPIYRNQNIG